MHMFVTYFHWSIRSGLSLGAQVWTAVDCLLSPRFIQSFLSASVSMITRASSWEGRGIWHRVYPRRRYASNLLSSH